MIVLPFPPSINHYWRTFKGRMLLSKEGREYRKSVAGCVLEQKSQGFDKETRLKLEIWAYMPDNRRRDIDNLCKAVLDGLGHAGIYDDDCQIDALLVYRMNVDKENPHVKVWVTPA